MPNRLALKRITLSCRRNFWLQLKKFDVQEQWGNAGIETRHEASRPMKAFILRILSCYKRYISPFLPPACRFEPTCSVYMFQAIQKKGLLKGSILGLKRVLRCHPFCAGGFDPVP